MELVVQITLIDQLLKVVLLSQDTYKSQTLVSMLN